MEACASLGLVVAGAFPEQADWAMSCGYRYSDSPAASRASAF